MKTMQSVQAKWPETRPLAAHPGFLLVPLRTIPTALRTVTSYPNRAPPLHCVGWPPRHDREDFEGRQPQEDGIRTATDQGSQCLNCIMLDCFVVLREKASKIISGRGDRVRVRLSYSADRSSTPSLIVRDVVRFSDSSSESSRPVSFRSSSANAGRNFSNEVG